MEVSKTPHFGFALCMAVVRLLIAAGAPTNTQLVAHIMIWFEPLCSGIITGAVKAVHHRKPARRPTAAL